MEEFQEMSAYLSEKHKREEASRKPSQRTLGGDGHTVVTRYVSPKPGEATSWTNLRRQAEAGGAP